MLAGYNNYPSFTSHLSWKSRCHTKQSATFPFAPSFQRQSTMSSFTEIPRQSTMSSFTEVSEMNVDDTAEWIRNLGKSKGWSEVHTYADSFRKNYITGYLLDKLTIGSLKSELGITKYGHRLEIMASINDLYSPASRGENENMELSFTNTSPSSNGFNDILTNEGKGYIQLASKVCHLNRIAASLWTGKSAAPVVNNYPCTGLPDCSHFSDLLKHAQEVKKWVNPDNKRSNNSVTYNCPLKSEHSTADCVKSKSKRAGPGNHIAYKALHKVTIQKGKSFSSSIVGQLAENSIVLINQIKGRRGRIIMRKPNGEILVVGWVPLFTSKGHQLLAKYNKKGGAEVQNSDAVIEWKVKSPLKDFTTKAVTDSNRNES